MFKFFLLVAVSWILLPQLVLAENVIVFNFTEDEFTKLKVRKVKGKTTWSLGSNEKGNFIKAEAEGKGSGLGKEVKIDLLKTPFINITWKVEKDLSGIIENSKKGHDYAARVFVVKKTGSVKANVREHFKKLHDLDVKELSSVAIMTDTDNSKLKAIAFYQNIYFSSE